jgi:hypothetical protein
MPRKIFEQNKPEVSCHGEENSMGLKRNFIIFIFHVSNFMTIK